MVNNLRKILNILKTDNKPVWLFAILKMDEIIDRWSVIISAPWINEVNRKEAFSTILELLKDSLDKSDLASIARMSLLERSDYLIEELLKKKTGDLIKEEKINGNMVHEGAIIESSPDLVWSEENRNK